MIHPQLSTMKRPGFDDGSCVPWVSRSRWRTTIARTVRLLAVCRSWLPPRLLSRTLEAPHLSLPMGVEHEADETQPIR